MRRGVVIGLTLGLASSCSQARSPIPAAVESTTTAAVATTSTSTTAAPPSTTTRVKNPNPRHRYPVPLDVTSSYARAHAEYPATDVFADCGTPVLAMVDGEVAEARTVDTYDRATDNPALRGGPSVAIIGDDGVRYYSSHLGEVRVRKGQIVSAGDQLGVVAIAGDSTACHTHVGLSPACSGIEWSVRRGVIWPWPYLDAWRKGAELSPVDEIAAWLAANPDRCALALLDPHAADAG